MEALSPDDLIAMGKHPIASRVLDALLESPSVPIRAKRKLIMAFIGHFHILADDKLGSRVSENLWRASDVFLRVSVLRVRLEGVGTHSIGIGTNWSIAIRS